MDRQPSALSDGTGHVQAALCKAGRGDKDKAAATFCC